MMGLIYIVLAKSVALRIAPQLRKYIHKNQSGFIGGRSILDNILSVQLGIELAQKTHQNMVMLQLDYAKAFDTMAWDFIEQVLQKMGFGEKISRCIYLLGAKAYSRVLINGRLSPLVYMSRSVRQGCSLSPPFLQWPHIPSLLFWNLRLLYRQHSRAATH